MARNDPQVNLRLPAALKEQLQRAAEKNNRSLTAEIVSRLEGNYALEGGSRSDFDNVVERMLVALDPGSNSSERFLAKAAALDYLSADPGNDIRSIGVLENFQWIDDQLENREKVEKIKLQVKQRSEDVVPKAVAFLKKRGWKLTPPESTE